MSPLLSLESVSKSRGHRQLFTDLNLSVFKGDRIGLIGANGSGKSTLLKMMAGSESVDQGTIAIKRGLRIGYIPQESLFADTSIESIIIESLKSDQTIDDHERHVRACVILGRVGFEEMQQNAKTLSGGWKKRLEIARQLVLNPDVLLLDEPTNHLDLDGVVWLEKFLDRQVPTFIVISHDRYFLENVVNRMVELGSSYPKGLFANQGSYHEFLERRDEFLRGQVEYERALASKVRREIAWLKRGAKARTTKSRSRQDAAHRLIEEHAEVKSRNTQTSVQMDFSSTLRESRKLIAAKNLTKSLGGKLLFKGVDLTLSPGMRLGIVGENGTGKTTLLKLLADMLQPDMGTIKVGDGVRVLLFDQHREELPSDITLKQALAPSGDRVNYRGQMIHVNSWCQRFLFSPDRLELPISRLSGGERARVLIARLMIQPADVLLLDEPTNDLDIETLEMLEESLLEFPGAIVLISHDRYMLEQTCTAILGLAKDGEHVLLADYHQWEEWQRQRAEQRATSAVSKRTPPGANAPAPTPSGKIKLSYKETRELADMHDKIATVEAHIAKLHAEVESPEVIALPTQLREKCLQLATAEAEVQALYARWQELEDRGRV